MLTWEQIESRLKTMQSVMALHRIAAKKHSRADLDLIGAALNPDDRTSYFDIKFNRPKKLVIVSHNYDPATKRYLTVSGFRLPDVFQGLN